MSILLLGGLVTKMSFDSGAVMNLAGTGINAVTAITVSKGVTDVAKSAFRSSSRRSRPAPKPKKHSQKSHTTKSRTRSNSNNIFNRKWY